MPSPATLEGNAVAPPAGERQAKDEPPPGRDLSLDRGNGRSRRDITAELRGPTKAGWMKASVASRSEKPFNEERQFGEAKLPVFNWSKRM